MYNPHEMGHIIFPPYLMFQLKYLGHIPHILSKHLPRFRARLAFLSSFAIWTELFFFFCVVRHVLASSSSPGT